MEAGDRGTTIHLGVIHFNSQVMGRRCRFLCKCFIFVLWSVPIFIYFFFLTHLCWNITEFKSASRVPDERGRQRERNPEKENVPGRVLWRILGSSTVLEGCARIWLYRKTWEHKKLHPKSDAKTNNRPMKVRPYT